MSLLMDWLGDGLSGLLSEYTWRDGVLLAIVLLTLYFVVMVLRLSRIRSPRSRYGDADFAPAIKTPPPEFDAPPGSVMAAAWQLPPEPTLEPVITSAPPLQPEGRFARQLAHATLESEVHQLHADLQNARNEIVRLRGEVEQIQATHNVSPLYNEAMSMAMRGVDADGISGRCGISVAEAELVVALSRKPASATPPFGNESENQNKDTSTNEFDFIAGEEGYGRDGRRHN